MAKNTLRVAVFQRFLPHYRLGFFEQLHRKLTNAGGTLRLFYSYELGKLESVPTWATRIPALRIDLRLAELEDSAVLAPTIPWELIQFDPDVVILEDVGGLPNSLLGAMYCRLRKTPYLVWGLGRVPAKRPSRLRRALAPAIRFLYEGAFGFLCYSAHAARVYARYGKPTYIAPNSFLAPPDDVEFTRLQQSIECRNLDGTLRAISIGTLKRQKRFDVLLHGIARTDVHVVLDLVGDGPEASTLRQLAIELGIADRVVFHGALYSRAEKHALLRTAHIGVIPGRGGLAIQELMAHGVPVVSGVADGTEEDLVCDGINGYLLSGFPTADSIAAALGDFAARTPDCRRQMSRAALDVVVHASNTTLMVDVFARALREAVLR